MYIACVQTPSVQYSLKPYFTDVLLLPLTQQNDELQFEFPLIVSDEGLWGVSCHVV